MNSITNHLKGLKTAARFNRLYKSLPSPFKNVWDQMTEERKTWLYPVKQCCLPTFFSGGLAMPSAFLAATPLCTEDIMWLSSCHGGSLQWKSPPEWGFWAQTFSCILFGAFYNKPSPTQIHIFIILFLEMQFEEGSVIWHSNCSGFFHLSLSRIWLKMQQF